jgi:hypothetical protein
LFGIVTKNYQVEFEKAIGESGVFHWDGSSLREQLDAAARVQIRTLIVDVEVAPVDQLTIALRSFRRQRPHTRIILFGRDRRPGDKCIGICVALGIYDVVIVHTDEFTEDDLPMAITNALQEKLNGPASTYADAAKWDLLLHEDTPNDQGKKGRTSAGREHVKEKIVIQERLIGTPVITVTGAHPGAGTTYCCLQICQLLSEYGKVAYVELEGTNGFTREEVEFPMLYNGIEMWRVPSLVHVTPKTSVINYIVVNVGYWRQRTDEVKGEVRRASKAFITVGSSPWRYRDFSEQVDSLKETRDDWNILLQSPSDQQTKEIKKDVDVTGWPIFPVPYQPEPFKLSDPSKKIFEEALAEYLPRKPERSSLFSRLLSKAKPSIMRQGG